MEAIILGAFCLVLFGISFWLLLSSPKQPKPDTTADAAEWLREARMRRAQALRPDQDTSSLVDDAGPLPDRWTSGGHVVEFKQTDRGNAA